MSMQLRCPGLSMRRCQDEDLFKARDAIAHAIERGHAQRAHSLADGDLAHFARYCRDRNRKLEVLVGAPNGAIYPRFVRPKREGSKIFSSQNPYSIVSKVCQVAGSMFKRADVWLG